MKIIIISGPEATGKSAIGRELSKLLSFQYVSKDMIKESLFDSVPNNTWDYKWFENKAKDIFFETLQDFIKQNTLI